MSHRRDDERPHPGRRIRNGRRHAGPTRNQSLVRNRPGDGFCLVRRGRDVPTVAQLSLTDGIIAAYARHHDLEYIYGFDGGFDGLDDVTQLAVATDPYAPD